MCLYSWRRMPAQYDVVWLEVRMWEVGWNLEEVWGRIRQEIHMEGVEWQEAKAVPLAFGMMKMLISCKIELNDSDLHRQIVERIEQMDDLVQSVDTASICKI